LAQRLKTNYQLSSTDYTALNNHSHKANQHVNNANKSAHASNAFNEFNKNN